MASCSAFINRRKHSTSLGCRDTSRFLLFSRYGQRHGSPTGPRFCTMSSNVTEKQSWNSRRNDNWLSCFPKGQKHLYIDSFKKKKKGRKRYKKNFFLEGLQWNFLKYSRQNPRQNTGRKKKTKKTTVLASVFWRHFFVARLQFAVCVWEVRGGSRR